MAALINTVLIDGDLIDTLGYVRDTQGRYRHRLVAEKVLGRELKETELVHHIDSDKSNNSKGNLVICPNQKYHMLLHAHARVISLGGDPYKHKYCSYHKVLELRSEFSPSPSVYDGIHNTCRGATNEYRRINGLNKNKFDWKARLNQQYRRIKTNYTSRGISWLTT